MYDGLCHIDKGQESLALYQGKSALLNYFMPHLAKDIGKTVEQSKNL